MAAQTPPPFGGQAIMVETLLQDDADGLEFVHTGLRFSRDIGDMGRRDLSKLVALVRAIAGIVRARRRGCGTLYYCVSGAQRFPLWRDAVVLGATRRLFRFRIYHFHAAGAADFLEARGPIERALIRRAIGAPELAIKLSASSPPDPEYLGAQRVAVVPNGVDGPPGDETAASRTRPAQAPGSVSLLSVGLISADKGAVRLLETAALLRDRGVTPTVSFVGEFGAGARDDVMQAVDRLGLDSVVRFPGLLTGPAKWQAFADADALVFLTRFPHENTPLIVAEAMAARLPVIAADWRGIPGLLSDGCGMLVKDGDPALAAQCCLDLLVDHELREDIVDRAYRRWSQEFTREAFRRNMETAIMSLISDQRAESVR